MSFILILSFFATRLAYGSSANPEIKDLLQNKGALVFLQPEHIPSHFKDGTPNYFEMVIYKSTNKKSNMSCLAEYATAYLKDLRLVPSECNEAAGGIIPWNEPPRYTYESLPQNRFVESFVIRPFQENGLVQVSCSVTHHDPSQRMTLEDFEDGTGGRLTFLR